MYRLPEGLGGALPLKSMEAIKSAVALFPQRRVPAAAGGKAAVFSRQILPSGDRVGLNSDDDQQRSCPTSCIGRPAHLRRRLHE